MMEDKKAIENLADKAHSEEVKASNEMFNDEQVASQQREQLESCLLYREECLEGLKTAKSSGLSVVQVRECQLLIQYLDSVVETRQYKADLCEEKCKKSKIMWQKKNEHYTKLKEKLEQMKIEARDRIIDDDNNENVGTYKTYIKKS